MNGLLVKFSNVHQAYDQHKILENINFTINESSITTIIGPNGAGKTSIAKLLVGITSPVLGEIYIKPNLRLSYIPQKLTLDVDLPLSVADFLSIVGQCYDKSNFVNILTEIGLKIELDVSVHNLSGGGLQKLLLAAALLNKPELIVMDEATQNLDVPSQALFYKTMSHINKKYSCALFMISHDLFTVMRHSEHVICLNKHICCQGQPSHIVNDPEYIKIFGPEYSNIATYVHHHDHHHS